MKEPTLEEVRGAIYTIQKAGIKLRTYCRSNFEINEDNKIKSLIESLTDFECTAVENYEKAINKEK